MERKSKGKIMFKKLIIILAKLYKWKTLWKPLSFNININNDINILFKMSNFIIVQEDLRVIRLYPKYFKESK